MPEALANAPELPSVAAHVWRYFTELHAERGENGMGAARITATTMKDWCWATGTDLELWERVAIRRIDAVWFEVHAK